MKTETRTEKLSDTELLELEKELKGSRNIALVFFLTLLFGIHIAIFAITENWSIRGSEVLLFVLLFLIVMILNWLVTRKLREEILAGEKIISWLPVTEKYSYLDRQDLYSMVVVKYAVIAGGEKFLLQEAQYNLVDLDDFIEIHRTPIRNVVLKIEVVDPSVK